MSTNKSDEDPGKPSLPVQTECVNCHHKSANETQFYCWICWPNHHLVCPKCQETGISCPIYKMSLLKNKAGEGSDQYPAGYSGSEVGEVNRDDFIESDEKMVIKVKTGQAIKIFNDADNGTVTLTKNPSITSISTSGNVTSQDGPYGLNNVNSSVSNWGTIQVGEPVVGNSSTATIQTAPPPYTFGNMGYMGWQMDGVYGPESSTGTIETGHTTVQLPMGDMIGIVGYGNLGPGSRVRINYSTFTANGAIIYGDNNTINGNDNVIHGSNNRIFGDNNEVKGTNIMFHGNGNVNNTSDLMLSLNHNATEGCTRNICTICILLLLIIILLIYIIYYKF